MNPALWVCPIYDAFSRGGQICTQCRDEDGAK